MNKYQEALDRMYDNYVYGAKQKEDSYFTLQELVDKAIPPKDFDEAMKFHMLELQEHLGAIAKLQETFTYNELGSIHYKLNEDTVEEYLNGECEFAIKEVIENLDCYLDWSEDE